MAKYPFSFIQKNNKTDIILNKNPQSHKEKRKKHRDCIPS